MGILSYVWDTIVSYTPWWQERQEKAKIKREQQEQKRKKLKSGELEHILLSKVEKGWEITEEQNDYPDYYNHP